MTVITWTLLGWQLMFHFVYGSTISLNRGLLPPVSNSKIKKKHYPPLPLFNKDTTLPASRSGTYSSVSSELCKSCSTLISWPQLHISKSSATNDGFLSTITTFSLSDQFNNRCLPKPLSPTTRKLQNRKNEVFLRHTSEVDYDQASGMTRH